MGYAYRPIKNFLCVLVVISNQFKFKPLGICLTYSNSQFEINFSVLY
ncbi:hypothetical protein OURE66S_03513 [Oligella ureolytica]